MKKMLGKIPTEKEIDMLLDKGYEIEVYMKRWRCYCGDG